MLLMTTMFMIMPHLYARGLSRHKGSDVTAPGQGLTYHLMNTEWGLEC